jgi:tripartite ATP-independent transporter DctM subunit
MVIYAFLSNVSVARMFLGGVVPGLLTTLALMLYVRIVADRRGFPREPRASLRTIAVTARHGIAAIIAPGIIFASITTGFTTSTEAGVIACAYSLLLGAAYRSLDARKLWKAITDTMLVTALIMMILGFSTVMSWLIAIEQVPQAIAAQILTTTDNLYVFLAILLVFFLIVGCFVEGVPAKIILVPMLLPLIDRFGIDRVHFGLIIVFAFVIGVATPPMGIGLYIAVGVSGETFEKITMAALPMLIPPIIVLVLITYIPGLVLWLPNLVMGPP